MGISSREVDAAECDACGKIQYSPDSYAIYGVSGTVSVTGPEGGFTVNFFSCKSTAAHLGKAIVAVIGGAKS